MATYRRNVFIVRLVAVLHFSLAVAGSLIVCFTAYAAFAVDFDHRDAPYFRQFFWSFVGIDTTLLAGLALSSWFLWKLRRSGLFLLCAVLGVQLVYDTAVGALWLHPTLGMSAAMATGVGNMGLAPQAVLGYPLTGLIGVGILSMLGVWKSAGLTRGSSGPQLVRC